MKKLLQLIPCRFESFVKPWIYFRYAFFDCNHELGFIVFQYVFRIRLPFQMSRKGVKRLLLNSSAYIYSVFHKDKDAPSFRTFLKDNFPNFGDYRTKGIFVHPPTRIQVQELLRKCQYQRESDCLSTKSRKDGCVSCKVRMKPNG